MNHTGGHDTRKTGLIVALSLALLAVALIGFVIAKSALRSSTPGVRAGVDQDVGDLGADRPDTRHTIPLAGDSTAQIANVQGGRIQCVDKHDPTRTAMMIEWQALEPQPDQRARITRPVAHYYLRNGSFVRVSADRGTLYTPARSAEPESGTFSGGVCVALYQPRPDGSIDVKRDAPAGTLVTPTLSFDLTQGEINTPDAFTIDSRATHATGRGLRVLLDQVREEIALLRVEQDVLITHRPASTTNPPAPLAQAPASAPGAAASTSSSTPVPTPLATAAPGSPAATPRSPNWFVIPAGRQSFYRAVLGSGVTITQAQRTLLADRMELVARTVDNQLPPDAIGQGGDQPAPVSGDMALAPDAAHDPLASAPISPVRPDQPVATTPPGGRGSPLVGADRAEPITLSSRGPLVMKPERTMPEELTGEHLAVRFFGTVQAPATLRDPVTKALAQAPELRYGATSRTVSLHASEEHPASVSADGAGVIRAPHISMNLGTGVAQATGPGVLFPLRAGPLPTDPPEQRVVWNERATIEMGVREGWADGTLQQAVFTGSAIASGQAGVIAGDQLHARFKPDPQGQPQIARVQARGNVRVRSGASDAQALERGTLTAQSLDAALVPNEHGDPTPTVLYAAGDVSSQRGEQTLRAQSLYASVRQSAAAQPEVDQVVAERGVRFTGPQGLTVLSDKLDADAPAQRVELTGERVVLIRSGATVTGQDVRIDGVARTMTVIGPGTFDYTKLPENTASAGPVAPTALQVAWTKRLHVDDVLGTAVADGQAVATTGSSPDEHDVLTAQRISARFTPAPASAPGAPAGDSRPRELLSAEAIGSPEGGAELARVDSQRYVPSTRTLERRVYLEAARILADQTAGTITAPGAGKLLVDDRGVALTPSSRVPAAPPRSIESVDIKSTKGVSLFKWADGLVLSKSDGSISMRRDTQLVHLPAGQSEPVLLRADTMTAYLTQPGSGDTARPLSPGASQLRRALAQGGVTGSGPGVTSLIADAVQYDALRGSATAESRGQSPVVLIGTDKSTPVQAMKLTWTVGGEVRVEKPATIIAPQ